jgi:hypothetical protein
MANTPRFTPVSVPHNYPTSLIYLDESGSKASGTRHFFVIGGIKVRQPGLLARAVKDVRDRTGFTGEFKFNAITKGALPAYFDLINTLEASDAHLVATVVSARHFNPFGERRPEWLVHAEVIAQLLVGNINRCELISVLMDGISTPPECSLEDKVRELTNRRLRSTGVVTAAALDSKTSDLVQVADMVTGAILFQRRREVGDHPGRPDSPKARVAMRLGAAFAVPDLTDGRTDRTNIATYRKRALAARSSDRPPSRRLSVAR